MMTPWVQKLTENKMSELFGGFPTGGFPSTNPPAAPPSIEPAPTTTTPFVTLPPQMQMQLQMQLLLRQTIAQMITYSQLAPSMVQPTSSTSRTVRNDQDTKSVTRILPEKTAKKKKTPKEICCNGCAAPNCNECQHCKNRKWKKKCLKRQCLKKTQTSDKSNNPTRRTKRLLPQND